MSALPELPSCADSPKQRMVSFADCKAYGDARAAHARKQALEEALLYCQKVVIPITDKRCQNAFIAGRMDCEIAIEGMMK